MDETVNPAELLMRGVKSNKEAIALVKLVNNGNEDASKALVALLHRSEPFPEALSTSELCEIITNKETGCLQTLLESGFSGELELHNEIHKNDLEVKDMIGQGKSAKVYEGLYKGKKVAIKMFDNSEKIDDKEFRKEVSVISLVHKPSLVLICFGCSTLKGNKFIVTELMETSLYDIIQDSSITLIDQLLHVIAIATALSMSYLHSCNLIHRDLKSLNLLVSPYFEVKICDFGLSRVIDRNQPMTANIGTVCWVAPEIFNNKKLYSEKADVYSYGIILWELVARKMPFEDEEAFTIPLLVSKGKRPKMPKELPKGWEKLIKKSWNQNPAKRPQFDELCGSFETLYKAMAEKNPEIAKDTAWSIKKQGDTFIVNQLSGEEARKKGYPSHAIWAASAMNSSTNTVKEKEKEKKKKQ